MPIQRLNDPILGPVVLSRRKGSKHIRLSINPQGEVRVNVPYKMPAIVGLKFARNKKDWIHAQKQKTPIFEIFDGMLIGKQVRLKLLANPQTPKTYTRLTGDSLKVFNFRVGSSASKQIVQKAIIRSLMSQSNDLLLERLKLMADDFNYSYGSASIKLLRSRWGSCSSNKHISLSLFLIQLPWELIDYVLLHELVHTRQMNHGQKFWSTLEQDMPNYKFRRKELKVYRPTILS